MRENDISQEIIGAALDLHTNLGPGLLESAYECALMFELLQRGMDVKCQLPMPLIYKGVRLDQGYRLDLLVEDKVVVEIKSVECLTPVHFAQLLTYLRLSDKRLGLLINFNSKLLKHGIHRVANGL